MRRIHFIYFCIGLYAVIVQSVLLRELLVVVLGNEIVFGVSMGHWLLAVFAGALVGGQVVGRVRRPLGLFVGSALVMAVLPHILVIVSRYLYFLSGTPAGAYIPFVKVLLLGALVMMPFAFFVGFTFPLAAGLGTGGSERGDGVRHVASVYVLEAAGALVGGGVFSFFLAGTVDSFTALSVAMLPLLLMILYDSFRGGRRFWIGTMAAVLLVNLFALTAGGNRKLDAKTIMDRWQSFSSGPALRRSLDSRFQNVAVGEMMGQYFFYTNGQFSAVMPEENDHLVLAAHLMAQHPAPRKVMVIGEVLTGLGKYLLEYPIQSLTAVEMDGEYAGLIREFLSPVDREALKDPRLNLKIEDGRRLVNRLAKRKDDPSTRMDLVFIHMPEPSSLLMNRFYTKECFEDIASVLADGGVLALRITSSENYVGGLAGDYASVIYNTLKRVFPYMVVAPGEENHFFCSLKQGVVSGDPLVLAERYRKAGVEPRHLGMLFRSLYPPQKTEFLLHSLESSPLEAVNSDDRPLAIYYYNKILGWNSSGKNGVHVSVPGVAWLYVLFGTVMVLGLFRGGVIVLNRKKPSSPRIDVVAGVAVAGFTGISLELLIITAFQDIFGYVYQFIGLIIALFMAGLPLGALFAGRLLRRERGISVAVQLTVLTAVQLLLTSISLLIPFFFKLSAPGGTAAGLVLLGLVAVVGCLVGAIFPLSLNLTIVANGKIGNIGHSAGVIDAADHLGAALGAVLSGAFLLPLLGLRSAGYVLAACCFVSALLLATQLKMEVSGR
jgi:spermidine synthase